MIINKCEILEPKGNEGLVHLFYKATHYRHEVPIRWPYQNPINTLSIPYIGPDF